MYMYNVRTALLLLQNCMFSLLNTYNVHVHVQRLSAYKNQTHRKIFGVLYLELHYSHTCLSINES